jgi:cyanoexosortase A
MKVEDSGSVWLYRSSFWISVLATTLGILHIQLPFLLIPNLNNVVLHVFAWAGAAYLIWQRRNQLAIGRTDVVSCFIGTFLITLVLIRSWHIQGNPDILFGILPMFSAVALLLLSSGIRNLGQFKGELAMVAISVIPISHLMPYLDRAINFSLLAAKFSSAFLYFTGFEVKRQDVLISLPNGAVEVYTGCSGLPGIILMWQLGALFVIFCPVPRVILLALPIIGALIAFAINGVRIVLMALLVDAKNRPAFHYWHGDSGEQIFSLISIFLFCWICEWIWERSHSNREAS